MDSERDDDRQLYVVLVNDEEQYSLWPARKSVPKGWKTTGVTGQKQECLDYVEKVWTDITPRSVREALKESRRPETQP